MAQTLFAVPMTCEGCVKDISNSLYKLDGISKVEANLADQLVRIEGTGTRLLLTDHSSPSAPCHLEMLPLPYLVLASPTTFTCCGATSAV